VIGILTNSIVKHITVTSLTMIHQHVLYAWKIIPMKIISISPYEFFIVVIRYVSNVLKTHSMLGVVCADRKERREFKRYSKEMEFHKEIIELEVTNRISQTINTLDNQFGIWVSGKAGLGMRYLIVLFLKPSWSSLLFSHSSKQSGAWS